MKEDHYDSLAIGRGNSQFDCLGPNLKAGATTSAFILFVEGIMSWRASAYVKPLTEHPNGTKLTAREKLILFVLADSHNEERGNCAWISIDKAARDSLTSRSRFIELLSRIERMGTVAIERREGKSNLYRFPYLPVRESDPYTVPPVRKSDPTRPIATGPHPSDSYRTQASIEPSRTDITAPSAPSSLIDFELLNQLLDDWHARRWKTDEKGRYLITPATPHRKVYESEMPT